MRSMDARGSLLELTGDVGEQLLGDDTAEAGFWQHLFEAILESRRLQADAMIKYRLFHTC